MQTFITRMSYGATATDLDNARLGQQMTWAMQIFDTLTGVTPDFKPDHPVMGMWRGYEYALGIYGMMLNMEWMGQRGFADHQAFWFFARAIREMRKDDPGFVYEAPPWLWDNAVLLAHRSNLARRDRGLYGKKWKNCPRNWPYLWPQIDFDHEDGYTLWLSRADKKRLRSGERARPTDDVMERVVNA